MMTRGRLLYAVGGAIAAAAAVGTTTARWASAGRDTSAAASAPSELRAITPGADSPGEVARDMATPVTAAAAVRDTLVLPVVAAAEALAERQVTLVAQVSGRVERVPAREGESVTCGNTLVVIDDAEYALAVEEAAARERQARAQYEELTAFDLREPDSAVRAARARAARARSGLDIAAVALQSARLNAGRTRVPAPFSGVVADVRVAPGQFVRTGDELATIADVRRIRFDVQVLESDIGAVARGSRALISLAALPDDVLTGRVDRVNPLVDQRTRTARVTVLARNSRRRILPGMYARVALEGERLPDRVLVPRAAVLERDRRTMVFVFRGSGTTGRAEWRYVTTGASTDSLVEIVPGPRGDAVRPGEVVLTGGHESLIHGALVRLVPPSPAEPE